MSKDFTVAYVLWAKDGTIVRQGSLALLNSPLDRLTILSHLKSQAEGEAAVNWANVQCLSYDVLEPVGSALKPSYARYSCWVDQTELEQTDQVMSAVATVDEGFELTNSDALIEEVEEMLREERE